MDLAVALDFGSTFTKAVAFDLAGEKVIGRSQALSTVRTDINLGLESALKDLGLGNIRRDSILACSSAAGGLRMVVAGLVAQLTTQAAREACLGAGAKLAGSFSNGLTGADISKIRDLKPDIILLTGGTDGGNEKVILQNAGLIARSDLDCPVVAAGNRNAAEEVLSILTSAGKAAVAVDNVLPGLETLRVEPAREIIRGIFMDRITRAKGLDRARERVGPIIMPTPLAVLKAAVLLAEGSGRETGWGELAVVDIGGATTDVHSIARGGPSGPETLVKGLPEPCHKRTVEGDLGLRCNAASILEQAGPDRLLALLPDSGARKDLNFSRAVAGLSRAEGRIPLTEEELLIDAGLAGAAVELALKRHCGTLEEIFLPTGKCLVQRGKDLTGLKTMIGTGGVFARGRLPGMILKSGCFSPLCPDSLRPVSPRLFIDASYLMFAVGLLAERYPEPALRILKKTLKPIGRASQPPVAGRDGCVERL